MEACHYINIYRHVIPTEYVKEKTKLKDFRNKSLNEQAESYREKNKPLSVAKIIDIEGRTNAYKRLVYLDEEEINIGDLYRYLYGLLSNDKTIVINNSELKRLIRMYDFLKNRNA